MLRFCQFSGAGAHSAGINYSGNDFSSSLKLLWKQHTIEVAAPFSSSQRTTLFPNSLSSDWQSTGCLPIQVVFTICRRPRGKFHLQHPPIPSSPQVKWVSSYWRTENCRAYVERHLLGLDRTPVITVKWNYLISSQNAPSAFWHGPLIVCIQLMQRLEAAFSAAAGQNSQNFIKLI